MDAFWTARHQPDGTYSCPTCTKSLKLKLSQSPKNPGRSFVSCSKDYQGCGLFCFTDEPYVPKFAAKRPKVEGAQGTNLVGPIANAPNATDTRLAELATKIDQLVTSVEVLGRTVSELAHK